MEPFVQQLLILENTSFLIQVVDARFFETGWRQHTAFELILFLEGSGQIRIGQYEGNFGPGDLFFLGPELPYQFQLNSEAFTNAIVLQFRADCWGSHFLAMPECTELNQLLQRAAYGLQFTGMAHQLRLLITALETATLLTRIIFLLQCLQIMVETQAYKPLNKQREYDEAQFKENYFDRIIQYTCEKFQEPVTLSKVASIACMSVPSFCNYFKQRTQKTYFKYLNEMRVGYACNQLQHTNKSVTDICYESGFNTVTHFHRQFLRIKKTTPLQYRKQANKENAPMK
jgi:AraC-like DNA-binding protein